MYWYNTYIHTFGCTYKYINKTKLVNKYPKNKKRRSKI
jgi:hypothetical protein